VVPLKVEYLHNAVAIGRSCKEKYLQITVVFRGPFLTQSSVLAHCSYSWEPLERQSTESDVVWKILYKRMIHFSPKRRNIYAQNTLMGAFKKWRPEASVSLAFP